MTYLVFSMGLRANKRNETKTRGEARVVGEEGGWIVKTVGAGPAKPGMRAHPPCGR